MFSHGLNVMFRIRHNSVKPIERCGFDAEKFVRNVDIMLESRLIFATPSVLLLHFNNC